MKLSIVVIEYHSLNEIERFINQLSNKIGDNDYEVIVSSNSQYKTTEQEIIKSHFSKIKWLFNARNGGFAYGMNRGLELAQGDYLMIANPDLVLKYGVKEAIQFLQEHLEVGAIGPAIKDSDGELQDSARPYVTFSEWLKRQIKRVLGRAEHYDYSQIQTVDWVIGACILMTRDSYKKIGGLDEAYFMYAEDLDLCTRIREKGLEIVYYPKMEVEYKGTRSARHSLKYAIIFFKSHWHYWKKFGFFGGQPIRKDLGLEKV